jgi:hypothetical protein
METVTTRQDEHAKLTTADLAAAAEAQRREPRPDDTPVQVRTEGADDHRDTMRHDEELAALFAPEAARDFRARWDAVQIGFVDDPAKAVREADELVAEVMKSLADTFAAQRAHFEGETPTPQGAGDAATEGHRVALRRYRSFFQRLLSL